MLHWHTDSTSIKLVAELLKSFSFTWDCHTRWNCKNDLRLCTLEAYKCKYICYVKWCFRQGANRVCLNTTRLITVGFYSPTLTLKLLTLQVEPFQSNVRKNTCVTKQHIRLQYLYPERPRSSKVIQVNDRSDQTTTHDFTHTHTERKIT